MEEQFVCKVASVEEMNQKWDYEIAHSRKDRENWIVWKERHIEYYQKGYSLPYYGILDGQIICEATALLHPLVVQNSDGLVDSHTVYLSAFRTIEVFQGKGYFSKLFRFMLDDLRQRGYTRATLGVEPWDETNKRIYAHYGFNACIKSGKERYPDGSEIVVEYYGRDIETEWGCTGKVIAACGNNCSACPRYTAHPYKNQRRNFPIPQSFG